MAPIDDAIAAIDLLEPGEDFAYREIARRFNVSHATLTRRHKGR
jgi:DNA-binding GntR family transcriptional regulator